MKDVKITEHIGHCTYRIRYRPVYQIVDDHGNAIVEMDSERRAKDLLMELNRHETPTHVT